MNKSEITELVELCSYPELQKLWRPKVGDEFYDVDYPGVLIVDNNFFVEYPVIPIWLPRIEDCIRLMGNKFNPVYEGSYSFDGGVCWNKSARIACLRALKATLKGG